MDFFEKQAFNINLPIPAIVGATTGTLVAKNTAEKKFDDQIQQFNNTQVLPGSYYAQTENIANNLKVMFTPYSVVYIVRNGDKEIAIDNIPTEAMNKDMYMAWQEKNAGYFKNILLNKMRLEIQFAQQQFAKNIIDRQLAVSKQASYDMTPIEIMAYGSELVDIYNKEENEKLASVMFDDILSEDYSFNLEIYPDMTKEAMEKVSGIFGTPLNFLSLSDKQNINNVQGQIMTPGHIKRFGKVGFLPDRVVFVVDNMVITQLTAFDMDEDAFKAFEKKDGGYFMNLFEKEAKTGARRLRAKFPPEKKNLDKTAGVIALPIENIFYENDINPFLYYKILTEKYGEEWFNYSAEVLVKVIEKDFGLVDPIMDIPLNKILSIQLVNASDKPFKYPLAFEKVIRSFANLPINFEEDEKDDIDPKDFAIGLTMFDMVTPNNDTYDDFSPEVYSYIVTALADNEMKFFFPDKNYSNSETFSAFYDELNKCLVDENIRREVKSTDDLYTKANIICNNEKMNLCCMEAFTDSITNGTIDDNMVTSIIDKYRLPRDLFDFTRNQIAICMSIDEMLQNDDQLLKAQMGIYNLEV